MTLWGSQDTANGYHKPVYANTSNISSQSTINGSVANSQAYYGEVFGVSSGEMANAVVKPAHSGWVSVKTGTGPIQGISWSGGTGYNSAGFLTLVDTSPWGQGSGANASFTIANSQNTMQAFSSNAQLNVINSITVVSGGTGWSDASKIAVNSPRGISNATFTFTLGGRGGRKQTEVLVAMNTISGDDPRDNVAFPGV